MTRYRFAPAGFGVSINGVRRAFTLERTAVSLNVAIARAASREFNQLCAFRQFLSRILPAVFEK
jgi:hypothetical protein